MLLALLLIVAIAYVAVVIWLLREETRLVFQAGSTLATGRPTFPYEQIDIPRTDAVRQFGWVIRHSNSDAGLWVLYLHGNVTSIASDVNISHYAVLRGLRLNVLAPEFQGFGGIEGVPTESTLRTDARLAYDYLRDTRQIPAQDIVLYGWSLGSAVGVDLAARLPPRGMILEGAPASLVDLTGRKYPFLPLRLLMRSSFDSIRTIGRIAVPMLFIHSSDDEVIPVADGRRLFDAARAPKTFVEVQGGHFGAIDASPQQFAQAIREFLSGTTSGSSRHLGRAILRPATP